MADRGIILPIGVSWRAVSSSTKWVSWRIFTCIGKPRFLEMSDTAQDLLRQPVVLVGSCRPRSEGEDRLPVGRALFEADALGDDGLEHLDPEDPLNLLVDVLGEQRPLVIERDQRPQDLELRIGADLDLVDRL